MKNGMKRIVGAAVAVLTMAVSAMSAFAADYAQAPTFSTTPSATVSVKTDTIFDAISNAEASEDGDKAVAAVEVNNLNNVKLTSAVLKELAKGEDTVLTIKSSKAEISIDSKSVEKARNIDLSMKVNSTDEKTVINMKSTAKFGCEVKITVTSCKLSEEALAKAHVYCGKKDLGPVVLNDKGQPVITVTKGGVYTIK